MTQREKQSKAKLILSSVAGACDSFCQCTTFSVRGTC